jgi:VCBS repeat-containing protein
MRGRCLQLLRCLGLLMGLLCMLVGCGGNSGSSETTDAVSRGRPLSLQFRLSSQLSSHAVRAARHKGPGTAQVRQIQPGDPGFINQIEIRLQVQGSDLVPPQVFMLDAAEQETVTREVTVPDTAPPTFQVLVSCFNSQGIEVFRGDTTVAFGQTSAVVTLVRTALLPVPATPANLQQTTFLFTDGAVFGLPNMPVTLATGTFEGNVGDFALTAHGLVASGSVLIGSCTFVVTTSTFPPEQGLQVGDKLILDPCQVDALDGRLIATNAIVSLTDTSNPPVVASPDTTLNLPTPSTLVIDENTAGTLQIAASISGTRPASISLGITIPPAHGTATLTNTGVVTYRPVANFNGSDRLVVTVVVSFTDNNSPSLLLGTVQIPVTVRPVNHAPAPTAPGIGIPQNTTGTSQISTNDPDAGQTLAFSVSTPPAHGTATITPSGLATYTPALGFSGADSFGVTVTDNGTPPLAGTVTIAVTVMAPPNLAPAPTAPAISTPLNTLGTSQISANDPDLGQSQTFAITTLPANGTASVNATGLVMYTPNTNFTGTDSLVVTVTDNGTPPLAGTVTISVTITIPGVVAWTTPAPASVASGQAFPLALTVAGNFLKISGEVLACPTTVPVDQCAGFQIEGTASSFSGSLSTFTSSQFQVTPSSFSGAPGTFTFTAQGSDCQGPEDFYFVARLFLLLPGSSTFLGPFFGPLTTTTVQAPTGPLLQVLPQALTVNAFAGLNPPPHTLVLTSACGEALNFSARADVPWLSLTPPAGTVPVFGQQQVGVAVDVMGLNAAQSPFAATVTVTAPGALNTPLSVPLTLNLLGP